MVTERDRPARRPTPAAGRTRLARRTRTLTASLAALASALGLADATHATFPGANGALVYQATAGGDYDLQVQPPGQPARTLVARPGTHEFNPAFSPSGTRLVFQSGPLDRSDFDLYLARADGTGLEPLATGAAYDYAGQFCDERTVVFSRRLDATNTDVFVVRTDGTGLRQLTDHPATDSFPTCSPDGSRVAFISNRDGSPSIYEIPLAPPAGRATAEPRRLTDGVALDPDYRPDGKAVLYVAPDPTDGNLEVFERTTRGGSVQQLTATPPPLQARLPHYLPAGAVATARTPAGQAHPAIAYTEDSDGDPASDADKRVVSTAPGATAVPGSAGIVRPLPRPCECLRATIRAGDVRVSYLAGGSTARARLRLVLDWRLECRRGTTGPCRARLAIDANRGFDVTKLASIEGEGAETRQVPLRPGRPITCQGACEPDPDAPRLTAFGDIVVELETPVPALDLLDRDIAVDVRTRCGEGRGLTRFSITIGDDGRIRKVTRGVID